MHIMVVPSWYSSKDNKVHGSFFKEQFQALQKSGENISVAYNEIWPITKLGRIHEKKGISYKIEEGLKTYRYKNYNYLPKNSNMFKIFNKRMEKLYLEIVKREGKVDVIHAHSALFGGISAAYVAKKYNIPFVLTEHSSVKHAKYIKDSYMKYIKQAYDSADALIAVGNGLKEELKLYTKNEVTVVHNLIDFSMFKPTGIKNEKIKLFSLAYLVKDKGMDVLLKAFKEAFNNTDVTLTIGGDGVEKDNLIQLAKDLGIEDKVKFLGLLSREEVVKEMDCCDGFVLASKHETFGVVYIEALAMGKPVLGTKNGGSEDIIKEYNGILVENTLEDLVLGLKEFVSKIYDYDSKLIADKCRASYSEEVIVEEIKNIYIKLKDKTYQ